MSAPRPSNLEHDRPDQGDDADTFISIGEASASIIRRLAAMREQANRPLDRSA